MFLRSSAKMAPSFVPSGSNEFNENVLSVLLVHFIYIQLIFFSQPFCAAASAENFMQET